MKILFSILLSIAFLFHQPETLNGKKMLSYKPGYADTASKKGKVLNFPTPTVPRLFYVQRDPNINTIIYDLNVNAEGQLDNDNPIHPYWIRYNDKGQKEELNYIQRKFAYGLNIKPLGNNKFDVRFVSYKQYPLTLMKSPTDNKYHVYATVTKKLVVLSRIFLRIEGGTFWFPNVVYVEVKGTDPDTGKEVSERFKP
jgi:hypothetical protein